MPEFCSGLTGRPFQLAACQQMHVQMGNSFPGVMPIVGDQAKATFIQMKSPGNPPDCQHHGSQKDGIFLPGLGKAGEWACAEQAANVPVLVD